MPEPRPPPGKPIHGYTGPTTPAEEAADRADPGVITSEERARLAEEASRAEDA